MCDLMNMLLSSVLKPANLTTTFEHNNIKLNSLTIKWQHINTQTFFICYRHEYSYNIRNDERCITCSKYWYYCWRHIIIWRTQNNENSPRTKAHRGVHILLTIYWIILELYFWLYLLINKAKQLHAHTQTWKCDQWINGSMDVNRADPPLHLLVGVLDLQPLLSRLVPELGEPPEEQRVGAGGQGAFPTQLDRPRRWHPHLTHPDGTRRDHRAGRVQKRKRYPTRITSFTPYEVQVTSNVCVQRHSARKQ